MLLELSRRKLRRGRKGARALSSRAESADRRDRQRQIDRGGCAGAAAGRARGGGDGPQRGGAGAHLRNLRSGRHKRLPEGIELEDGELIIEREILPNGKSRAFAGGRPVTAALLKELARSLGDIHGQHDQQQLFSGSVQREMLDAFADAGEQVTEVGLALRALERSIAGTG